MMPEPLLSTERGRVTFEGITWTEQDSYCPCCGRDGVWANDFPVQHRLYLCTHCVLTYHCFVTTGQPLGERRTLRGLIFAIKTHQETHDEAESHAATMAYLAQE